VSIALLWRFFYFAWFGSEIVIAIATRTRHSSGNVRDRGTFLLLWVVIVSSITAGIWLSDASSIGAIANAQWMRPSALALLIAGLALRWAAIVSLGRSFSSNVAIHSTQTVLKTGLYHWMRHPSYTGLIMIFVSVGLHTRNWISFLIVVIPTTAALLYRIHVEEIALRGHFGEEYESYSRQTKRLIPGVY
jgi:protein-S-isoprenylcysteine O-methyltransferase Ste14